MSVDPVQRFQPRRLMRPGLIESLEAAGATVEIADHEPPHNLHDIEDAVRILGNRMRLVGIGPEAAKDSAVDLLQLIYDGLEAIGVPKHELDAAVEQRSARLGTFSGGSFVRVIEVDADAHPDIADQLSVQYETINDCSAATGIS